jgi:hypothetical protein
VKRPYSPDPDYYAELQAELQVEENADIAFGDAIKDSVAGSLPLPPPDYFAALQAKLKACDAASAALDMTIDAIQNSIAASLTLKSPPELCIQAWVPEPIARYFRERYEAVVAPGPNAWLRAHIGARRAKMTERAPALARPEIDYEDLDLVARLVSHQSMRPFYREIFRRVDGVYAHRATIEGEDAESRQNAAVIKLLDAAVHAAKTVTMTPTKAEAKQHFEESCLMHHLLLGDLDNPWLDRDTLYNAAMVYFRGALVRYDYEMRFATLNKSRHSRNRALVIRIADKIQKLFRKKLYGSVAKLATAATGREITKVAVQKWLTLLAKHERTPVRGSILHAETQRKR